MLKPPINDLVELPGCRYTLVIAASKRARQIIQAELAEDLILKRKPLSEAIDDLYDGSIQIVAGKEEDE